MVIVSGKSDGEEEEESQWPRSRTWLGGSWSSHKLAYTPKRIKRLRNMSLVAFQTNLREEVQPGEVTGWENQS